MIRRFVVVGGFDGGDGGCEDDNCVGSSKVEEMEEDVIAAAVFGVVNFGVVVVSEDVTVVAIVFCFVGWNSSDTTVRVVLGTIEVVVGLVTMPSLALVAVLCCCCWCWCVRICWCHSV